MKEKARTLKGRVGNVYEWHVKPKARQVAHHGAKWYREKGKPAGSAAVKSAWEEGKKLGKKAWKEARKKPRTGKRKKSTKRKGRS